MDSVSRTFSNLEHFGTTVSVGEGTVFFSPARSCRALLEGWMWTTQAGTNKNHVDFGRQYAFVFLVNIPSVPLFSGSFIRKKNLLPTIGMFVVVSSLRH